MEGAGKAGRSTGDTAILELTERLRDAAMNAYSPRLTSEQIEYGSGLVAEFIESATEGSRRYETRMPPG